ncbi:LPS export ABC transporter ATP-binding protein [Thermotoga neapolitana]|uniref:Lipopolysaccharide export system ATP-binding protein LptB n=1 Tax=Thermotoga neapolitana (strain ATCC 49049 / DSM 4359 / NBRC 107923 / NS-E) TaxID=309803 RepID=B9K9Q6_THENN|nr:LPS export ABC transporter ATP-binding protein [Thermotoga neapolitana]ACM23689.1 ABC transporter related [Thermotoga neapolitana DSM 4359]HBF10246.1 LPS export ABC transporter ATP-binding protein [Thermotoga neapolitana]
MILRCVDLTKRFGKRVVVDRVNLEFNQGEVTGLLGPNGAGKTTIFNMILGVVVPSSGKIFFENTDITRFPVYKRARLGITYLQQETSVFGGLTVRENLELVLRFFEKDREKREEKIEQLLHEFHLKPLENQPASFLSGGEKRKLELARMMCLNPSFVLLDEPFSGIDPKTVKEIQKMVLELKQRNFGVVVTDHNVDELAEIADRIYVIYKGKILAEGRPEEVLEDETVKEVYLGS